MEIEIFSKRYKESYLNRSCNNNTGNNFDKSQINCEMINLDNTWDFLENNSNYDNSIFSKIESFNLIDAKSLENIKITKEEFEKIHREKLLKNFTDYKCLLQSYNNLNSIFDEVDVRENNSIHPIFEHLYELRHIIGKIIYKIKIDFMKKEVVSTKPEEILFNELIIKTK
jgi:hypothetical protein